jgi:hypothetical protein
MQSQGSRASTDSRSAAVGRDALAGTTARGSDPPATLPQILAAVCCASVFVFLVYELFAFRTRSCVADSRRRLVFLLGS